MSTLRPTTRTIGRTIGQWLEGVDVSWPSIERHVALQRDVDAYCERMQISTAPVRETQKQGLLWLARSPSQAARLRNLSTGLAEDLSSRGWKFNGVTIRLQPDKNPTRPSDARARAHDKPGVSLTHRRQWEAMAQSLEEGPLRAAIEALVRHHGGV